LAGTHVPILSWRSPLARGAAYAAGAAAVVVFTGGTAVPFIYFQF
jgi:hypothetical protein